MMFAKGILCLVVFWKILAVILVSLLGINTEGSGTYANNSKPFSVSLRSISMLLKFGTDTLNACQTTLIFHSERFVITWELISLVNVIILSSTITSPVSFLRANIPKIQIKKKTEREKTTRKKTVVKKRRQKNVMSENSDLE